MMNKKFLCLMMVGIMLISLVPASLAAAAPGDLSVYAKGKFTTDYEVYTGPGVYYHRANGNAFYGGGVCRIYGTTGDWLMIGYGGKNNTYRIGYIPKDALNYIQDQQGTIEELQFLNRPGTIVEGGCNWTDDPVINNTRFATLSGGTQVTILGYMGNWTYIEGTTHGGEQARGFVRSFHVIDGAAPTKAPTAVPTVPPAKPTNVPTYPPKPTTPPVKPTQPPVPSGNESLLSSLKHNCPNTGIMLPEAFSPYQTDYLLTVASWVSRVTFTPTAFDSRANITVNGQGVISGNKSQIIEMSNDPQMVEIRVLGKNGAQTTYRIFLQRRPSTARTRVSAGFIQEIYQRKNDYYISADLVTVNYQGDNYALGNRSNYYNDSNYLYKYKVDTHCDFYYGTPENAFRAKDIYEFMNNYRMTPGSLYTIVYMNDRIVAVMPYSADF